MNSIYKIFLNIKSVKNLSILAKNVIDIITSLDNTFSESDMIK